ncbi:hypothetical protein [Vibrio penaeicida]|uniref:hypothetical protein n=1 Tax=Vibrio penaeicida TaxID=104609 RepID=UPI00142D73E2|nr:hypothetical protein [Vibrio penaeicida]
MKDKFETLKVLGAGGFSAFKWFLNHPLGRDAMQPYLSLNAKSAYQNALANV